MYSQLYLSNLNDAIYEDNVNLTGYMAWSLIDDFEWQYGYKYTFITAFLIEIILKIHF